MSLLNDMSRELDYTSKFSTEQDGFTIVKNGVMVRGFRNSKLFWVNRATAERNLCKYKGGKVVTAKKLLGDSAKGNALGIRLV